jgi:hypothetical protein
VSGEIQFHRSGEWTGVYLDGKLVRAGDHYLADEWLQARVGVKVVDSDAWIPDGRNALETLADVKEETERREGLAREIQRKRDQMATLEREARELERQIRRS